MSGISEAAAALATISSLNPQRSSIEPPPRATMIKSGRGKAPPGVSALKPAMARATSDAQLLPCTATGQTKTLRGNLSRNRCKISRITAPVGDVTTPITSGKNGRACFRAGSNKPSAAKAALRFSSMAIKAPTPATATSSTLRLYFDCPPKAVILPVTTTSIPSSGMTERFDTWPFQVVQASELRSSFTSKYICPERAKMTRPTSPLTRIRPNSDSSERFTAPEISETVNSGAFSPARGSSIRSDIVHLVTRVDAA